MAKAKKWVRAKHFDGFPKETDFTLIEEDLPPLQDGEILCEAVFLSVDPYMRMYMSEHPDGSTMIGTQVALVTESKNAAYPVGKFVLGGFGWRSHTVCHPTDPNSKNKFDVDELPEMGELQKSLALGVLGMPGATAYLGLLRVCEPKPKDVVLVSGAAGAVGSLVGQIAKIHGCTVIGYAGSDAKCDWLKEIGFDHVFNYKKTDLSTTLKQAAPNGVDCYFDNVGGHFTSTVLLNHMRQHGRVAICGTIAEYNNKQGEQATGPYPWSNILFKILRVQGFVCYEWIKDYPIAHKQLFQWLVEGKIKTSQHITEGFAKMPKAFIGMLKGENIGKAIVTA